MKYFKYNELLKSTTAAKYKIDNTPTEKIKSILIKTAEEVLDPLREAFGAPIIVNSGYRCPAVNKKVGGAAASDHMVVNGTAAFDIRTVSNTKTDNKKLFDVALKLMNEGKLPVGQLIDEYNYSWVHISGKRTNGKKNNQVLHLK